MIRVRFYLNKKEVGNDYRPVIWPIKYPYWCVGENDNNFIMVAYVDSFEDCKKQWPEVSCYESIEESNTIKFSDRFPKPDWYEKT